MRKGVILFFIFCASMVLYAQEKGVSGKVVDENNEPMTGVTIVVKGSTTGTITDISGNFNLKYMPNAKVLVFRYVGYEEQEVEIGDKASINVQLEPSTRVLNEVVAIGYGTVKKSDLTGAVATLGGDKIASRKSTQVSQALQGAIPGLMVTRNNNAPGATATIRVRGVTTIGDSNPLIILDGVPVDDINNINANDIENISVLKDAASASIYGSRAAAGVILVTTKRAKTGAVSLTYSTEYGMETPTRMAEYVDVKRYMQLTNELRWNDNGNNANEYPTYPKATIEKYDSLNMANPNKYPNTDWIDLILKKNAPRRSHAINISAGTQTVRTNASIVYDKTDGLFENKSYERITARLNNDFTINKYLSATVDLSLKRSISTSPYHDPMYNMLIAPPVYAAQWSDGRVAEGKTGANPYGMMKYGGYKNGWYNLVSGKVSVDFTPFDGFRLSAVFSPTLGFDKIKEFNTKVPYTAADNASLVSGYLEGCTTTNLWEKRNDSYKYTGQLLANYMKSFGRHNINLMAGYEGYYSFNENLGASREKYELTTYPYLNLGPLDLRGNSGNAYENSYRSYFGRVMYNFNSRYFLQANVRYDGSSRFDKEYRWGSFPSFSGAWVISEESFMKEVPVISFLKLRASWGTLGNERIGNYPYQSTIAFGNTLFYQGTNTVAAQTAAQIQYAIRDISWETTQSTDFGLDLNMFKNRLRLSGDYYLKSTKDMLLALEIPDYIGFDNPDQNTGKMNTRGWELEVNWNDQLGDFGYSVSANVSDFQSKMGDLGGTEFIGDQIKKKGSEFNEWYGYRSNGLFQTAEDLAASPQLGTTQKVGDVKYMDLSGPDGVPDGKISPEYDRELLGGSLPRFLYGANIKFDYKNFDLGIALQGVGKVNVRKAGLMITPLAANWGNVPKILDGHSWSKYNSEAQNLAAEYPRFTYTNAGVNYAMSDFWLINGGYLRLKNITLGYTLPQALTKKANIQRIRLYASGSDLFTIDKFPKGWDPEVSESGYPITSTFLVGLSVSF